jgi:5-methylcytosine-specific restriction endonuclease McrA
LSKGGAVMGTLEINTMLADAPIAFRAGLVGMSAWLRVVCRFSQKRRNLTLAEALAIAPHAVFERLADLGMVTPLTAAGTRPIRFRFANNEPAFRLDVHKRWSKANYPAVYARDGHRCRYCGTSSGWMTVDHVTPRCEGGGDELENLVVACRGCNLRKSGKTPERAGMALLPEVQ